MAKLIINLPPELEELGLAPDLTRFFDAMIFKLRVNAHKGRWEDMDLDKVFALMGGEVDELRDAIIEGSSSEILMEAADVANFAMIASAIGLATAPQQNYAATLFKTEQTYGAEDPRMDKRMPVTFGASVVNTLVSHDPMPEAEARARRVELADKMLDRRAHRGADAWLEWEREFIQIARRFRVPGEEWASTTRWPGEIPPDHVDHPYAPPF